MYLYLCLLLCCEYLSVWKWQTSLGGGHVPFTHSETKSRIMRLFKEIVTFATLKYCEVLCYFKKGKFKKRVCTRLLDFYTDPCFHIEVFPNVWLCQWSLTLCSSTGKFAVVRNIWISSKLLSPWLLLYKCSFAFLKSRYQRKQECKYSNTFM